MEKMFYELRPFLLLYFAMAAHIVFPGPCVNLFATLLAWCMGIILWWRFTSRTGMGTRRRVLK